MKTFFAYLSILCLALSGPMLIAQTAENVTWSGVSGADFNTASNWSPVRVPGTDAENFTDTAIVSPVGTNMELILSGDVTFDRIRNNGTFSGGNPPVMTINLDGNTMNLGSTGGSANASIHLDGANQRAIVFSGGGTVNANTINILRFSAGVSNFTVTGAGTQVNGNNLEMLSHPDHVARVYIDQGATLDLSASAGWAMRLEGANAGIFVNNGSLLTSRSETGFVTVAHIGTAGSVPIFVEVNSGSSFEADNIALGMRQGSAGGIGTLRVQGEDSSVLASRIMVGAGANNNGHAASLGGLHKGGEGYLEVRDGATVTATTIIYNIASDPGEGKHGRIIVDNAQIITAALYMEEGSSVSIAVSDLTQPLAIAASGTLTINNATLILDFDETFFPAFGVTIPLISYNAKVGEFIGLTEGAVITAGNGSEYELTYNLNSTNMIGLTAIPEPSTYALILGVSLIVFRYRKSFAKRWI